MCEMLGPSEQCLSTAFGLEAQTTQCGLYESDDFRLYCYKILPCSRRTPHEWSSCPFAHPSEKAKRRNVRTHIYDCEMCPSVAKGDECLLGPSCPHSHNVFESWLHPQKYRTLLCKDKDKCTRAVCFFAHGAAQLRTPEDSYVVQQPGPVMLPATASLASSSSNSNSSIANSLFGSSGNLAVAQLASPGQPTAAWPLTAADVTAAGTSAASSPTEAANMQQMLAALISEVQAAQLEAHQQKIAEQHAQQQLRAFTAAVAELQAARAAADEVAAYSPEALSCSALLGMSLHQRQQGAGLDSTYGCHHAASIESLASSYPPLVQASVQQGNMAAWQMLEPLAAAAGSQMHGQGLTTPGGLTHSSASHVSQLLHQHAAASVQGGLEHGSPTAGLLSANPATLPAHYLLDAVNCPGFEMEAAGAGNPRQFGVAKQQLVYQAGLTQEPLGSLGHITDKVAVLQYA